MFRAFLILLLGTWCAVCRSQPVLTQESSMSASPGQTVKLSCSMSSGYPVQKYDQSWYQQKPGSPPKYIVRYYSSPNTGSGEFSRFSSSKESSRNTWYLTISNVQAGDEADYYCAVWYGSGTMYIFGSGTTLSSLGQAASPPTVNLFPPSAEERQSKNKATLVCLMDGFIPGAVTVTWQADGTTITNGVETTKPTKVNDKYMAASYLSMDKAEWELREKYSCKVTHAGTEYSKAINRSQCA